MWQFYWKHSNTHAMTSSFFLGLKFCINVKKMIFLGGYNSNLVKIIINPFIFLATHWKPTIEIWLFFGLIFFHCYSNECECLMDGNSLRDGGW
jgi:hypothetical protein